MEATRMPLSENLKTENIAVMIPDTFSQFLIHLICGPGKHSGKNK